MIRDATATRARILEAATDEFAAHGLAGARVDRLAARAGANKERIYAYFGSKEGLFDATVEANIEQLIDAVPFTADDLPGYAESLFEFNVEAPRVQPAGALAHPGTAGPCSLGSSNRPTSNGHKLAALRRRSAGRTGDGRAARRGAPRAGSRVGARSPDRPVRYRGRRSAGAAGGAADRDRTPGATRLSRR